MAELYSYDKPINFYEKKVLDTFVAKFVEILEGDEEKSISYFKPEGIFVIEVKDAEEALIKKIEITPLLRHFNKVHQEIDFATEKGEDAEPAIKKTIAFDRIYNFKDYDNVVAGNETALREALLAVFPAVQEEEYTEEDETKGLISFSNYYKSIGIKVFTTSPIIIEEATE